MNMTMKKLYNIVAIIGPSGCGKDTLLKELVRVNPDKAHKIINCTTRPIREGEVNGIDYHYLSNDEFAQQVLNFDMLEATCFNDWFYGTSVSSLVEDKINLGIFSPEAVYNLLENPNLNIFIIQLTASDKTRLLRQLVREEDPDVDEIIRRFNADKLDFANIDIPFRLILENESFEDLQYNISHVSKLLNGLGESD